MISFLLAILEKILFVFFMSLSSLFRIAVLAGFCLSITSCGLLGLPSTVAKTANSLLKVPLSAVSSAAKIARPGGF